MRLEVTTFDTGCTDKEQATKVLEEAAEVFGAWQQLDRADSIGNYLTICRLALGSELADVITAACNLAERYGIDMESEMQYCQMRNHMRGRC